MNMEGRTVMESKNSGLPKFNLVLKRPAIQFQARDQIILHTIYEVGGVMAKRQIKEMFWPNKTWRAMEKRLSKLYHNGFIDWPDRDQWRGEPIPEAVCWLGWKGAMLLAQSWGLQINPPTNINENQLRNLQSLLRKGDFHWMREPRWIQLAHDITVVDIRLLLDKAIRKRPDLTLSEWLHEGVFRSNMDIMEYQVEDRNGLTRKVKKGICPDAFIVIDDEQRKLNGQPYRARFLLEIDNATHDNPSFGLEKALPGAAYMGSPAYKQRFGQNSGRWLVVTTAGQRRMENLIRQTEQKAGRDAALFYFSTFEQLKTHDLLTAQIWLQAGSRNSCSLLV